MYQKSTSLFVRRWPGMPRNLHAKCGLSLTWFYYTLIFPHSRCSVSRRLMGVCSAWLMPGQISHTCLIHWTLDHDSCAQSCMRRNSLSLADTLCLTTGPPPPNVRRGACYSAGAGRWQLKTQQRGEGDRVGYHLLREGQRGRRRRSTVNTWLVGMIFFFVGSKSTVTAGRRVVTVSSYALAMWTQSPPDSPSEQLITQSATPTAPRVKLIPRWWVEKVSVFRGEIRP